MNALARRFRKLAAPAGALSAGGLAALLGACCGVPWLVAVIGVSGAIAVARLAFLAPYLWLLAFGFAIAALAWTYRAGSSCEVGCAPTQQRRRQIAAWLVVVTILGLFVATRGWHSLEF
ncbi:MAG: mercuric transporter MerT family protein [Rudaea sp.]